MDNILVTGPAGAGKGLVARGVLAQLTPAGAVIEASGLTRDTVAYLGAQHMVLVDECAAQWLISIGTDSLDAALARGCRLAVLAQSIDELPGVLLDLIKRHGGVRHAVLGHPGEVLGFRGAPAPNPTHVWPALARTLSAVRQGDNAKQMLREMIVAAANLEGESAPYRAHAIAKLTMLAEVVERGITAIETSAIGQKKPSPAGGSYLSD